MNDKTMLPLGAVTMQATADVLAHRFISANGEHCNNGDKIIGISTNDFAEGKLMSICFTGIMSVEAGGTIAAGDEVKATTNGKAISSATAAQGIIALDSGGNGSFIRVKL